jgi:hypothetical protein
MSIWASRYDQIRSEMLTRSANTNHAAIAEKIAKACLLTRPQESDMAAIHELVDTSLTSGQGRSKGMIAFAQANKTLLEYRSENYQAVIEWAQKHRESVANWQTALAPGGIAEPLFRFVTCLEALARLRLGDRDRDSANKEVNDFKQFVQQRSQIHTGSQSPITCSHNWHDWMLCEILVREINQQIPESKN